MSGDLERRITDLEDTVRALIKALDADQARTPPTLEEQHRMKAARAAAKEE
jgi:hypothetical protein